MENENDALRTRIRDLETCLAEYAAAYGFTDSARTLLLGESDQEQRAALPPKDRSD